MKEEPMTNEEMREVVNLLDINLFKIGYKTGVHLDVIEAFFKGKTDDMAPADRRKIEQLLLDEKKKAGKK